MPGARGPSTVATRPPGMVTLNARVAGAPLAIELRDVRLSPLAFRGTVKMRDVDVGLASLGLPPGGPLDVPRGSLTASITIEHDAVAGSRVGVSADLTGVELRRLGQARALVTAPAIRVTVDDLLMRSGAIAVKRAAVD